MSQLLPYLIAGLSLALAYLSFAMILANWGCLMLDVSNMLGFPKKSASATFMAGPIIGVIALLIYPFDDLSSFWWAPFMLDVVSIYLIPQYIGIIFMKND